MPINKNALLRYQILDNCFCDFHRKYSFEDLLFEVNKLLQDLYGQKVSKRQLREDIKHMRDAKTFNAPIAVYHDDNHNFYYRYSDENYAIYKDRLSASEITNLRSTIFLLKRLCCIPHMKWLEEIIYSLEFRLDVQHNSEKIITFDQNNELRGLEYLGVLVNATLDHQPLKIHYRTYAGREHLDIIHPYHLKQSNNRWFLLGLKADNDKPMITNRALDRILSIQNANVPFIPNTDIDFDDYFKEIVGVTLPEDHPEVEQVVLRFDDFRFPYLVSKPMHPSQIILDEHKHIIQLSVRPNKELESLILFYGKHVEVLHPLWLRENIANQIKEIMKIYQDE